MPKKNEMVVNNSNDSNDEKNIKKPDMKLIEFCTVYEFDYLTGKIHHSIAHAKVEAFSHYAFVDINDEDEIEREKVEYETFIDELDKILIRDVKKSNEAFDNYMDTHEYVCNLNTVNSKYTITCTKVAEDNTILNLANYLPYKVFLELMSYTIEEVKEEKKKKKENEKKEKKEAKKQSKESKESKENK